MKVLHISPSYFPAMQFGGPIRSVHLLNKALLYKGIQIEVLTTNAGLKNRKDISLNKKIPIEGIPVTFLPFWGYEHYNFSIPFLLKVFQEVKKFDVVHITAVWNFPVLAGGLACLWHNIPFVLSPRGTLYAETIAHRSSFIKKIYYSLLAGIPVKKASMLHFTTKDEAEKVRPLLQLINPYCIIPNGLDLSEIETHLTAKSSITHNLPENYLLFLGRIDRKKGLDIFLPAFAKISKSHPELKLVIAGPDNENYGLAVKEIALKLGIENHLIFIGNIEGAAKWEAYRNAKAFILTSYSENFGMTVAEAMACRCPVLISDKVALSEYLQNPAAGFICQTQVESIEKELSFLLDHPEIARERAKMAYDLVQREFNIEEVAEKFILTYQEIIQKHGS
jgi:glycosyltransferase involved in cell wall biosynthesis